jgi:hypothetical protein
LIAVALAQRHRVNHKQLLPAELHRHHLERFTIRIVAEEQQARLSLCPSSWWRRLLEAKTTVLDDMSDAGFRNSVLACRSGKP